MNGNQSLELKWSVKWNDFKWNDFKWSKMKWSEMKWTEMKCEMKWNEV